MISTTPQPEEGYSHSETSATRRTRVSSARIPFLTGDNAFLLFDLSGIDVSAAGFTVTLDAPGAGKGSPDPDAIAVVIIPEPATGLLLAFGLVGVLLERRPRKTG